MAAANALSDIYAMGGEPWCALNIAFFPTGSLDLEILRAMAQGGADMLREAGALLVGGHTVDDAEIRFGFSVAGIVDADAIAANDALRPGDILLLTKPLGTGVLATAVKARWEGWEESEEELWRWCSRLNREGARVIRELGLKAATDVTGFGLGGHLLEMARASGVSVRVGLAGLPLLPRAAEYAENGLVPAAGHANRAYCRPWTRVRAPVDEVREMLLFDPQSSGGLVLAVPADKPDRAEEFLAARGESCWRIGAVLPLQDEADFLLVE
ncbi:MAG: selenide, water dikinase SelD [Deltaproteobacteria bacterium]|nr:selenide, water dikinase SelD [Deltaproteobacteria bacterium]